MNHLGHLILLVSVGSVISYQGGGILQTLLNPKIFMSLLNPDQPARPASCHGVADWYCAVMYDWKNCSNWAFPVQTGKTTDIPPDMRSGTKAVVVKEGCKFVGAMPKKYTVSWKSFCKQFIQCSAG